VAGHLGAFAEPLPLSGVFDVPRLSAAIGMPVLSWDEVKDVEKRAVDELGCWSVWMTTAPPDWPQTPHHTAMDDFLQLGKIIFYDL
jgi:hypothetical protein